LWTNPQGDGWSPFAPSTVVRHVRRDTAPQDLRAALPPEPLELRRRCALESLVAYCQRVGDEATALVFARRIDEERVGAIEYQVPLTRADIVDGRTFLFPPTRIVGWTSAPDVPGYGDIDLDDLDLLERLGLACLNEEKLSGFPRWAQEPSVPMCRSCGSVMRYLLQLTAGGLSPVAVGGDGVGWIFVCSNCGEGTFTWQR
jgi:hypothetical protein